MKKILVSMFAVAALAACTSEQTIVAPQNEAIGFETFVDNSTRANDITTENIANFGVYGTVTKGNSALIFDNTKVEKNGIAYTYSPAQYWIAAAEYDFLAFAPYTERQWTYTPEGQLAQNGTFSFNNATAKADQDVVYAYTTKTTEATLNANNTQAVAFTFKHILSKVAFSFTNTFTDNNTTLNVYNVKINNTAETGEMKIANGVDAAWEVAGDLIVPFGAQAADATAALANGKELKLDHHYVIPAQRVYNITFDVDLYQAGVYLATYEHEIESTINFAKNGNYVLSVKLAPETIDPENELYPIEFTVNEVEDWRDNGSVALSATEVATADALKAAIAEGGEIRLTQDIDLDATRAAYAGLTISKNTILDGNGFKVSSTADRAINVAGDANLDVTIKNLVVEAKGQRAINVELCKNVILDNVTASATHYALNLVGAADNVNVVANNCNFNGLTVVNVWGENAKVTLNDSVLSLVDDEASEGYAAIQINDGADNSVVTVKGGKINITGSANDSFGGVVVASGASIIFNGTEGTTTIEGQPFVINYDNGYTYSFSTFAEAVETAKDGETIVLCQDVQIDAPLSVSKKIVFDLNGKNISAGTFLYPGNTVEEDSYAFWVKNGGDLTITGEGEISTAACDYSIAVWAQGGKVTINGGKFTNAGEGSDLIYASANGHVVINGGEFVACKKQAGVDGTLEDYSVLNLKGDNTGSSITCYGGRYYMFDPANNKSENPAVSFVAPGYESVVDGDYFKVVKK